MNFGVELTSGAEKYLGRLNGALRQRVVAVLEALGVDPFGAGSKPLAHPSGYRAARIGGLRVIYRVVVDERRVIVLRIGPRGEVYRNLGR